MFRQGEEVMLTVDLNAAGPRAIPAGAIGTVVSDGNGDEYSVEFPEYRIVTNVPGEFLNQLPGKAR